MDYWSGVRYSCGCSGATYHCQNYQEKGKVKYNVTLFYAKQSKICVQLGANFY